MEKKKIIERIKEKLLQNMKHYEKMFEDARQRSNESEGRNQTRYDSHKAETAYEAIAYAKKVLELKEQYKEMYDLPESEPGKVSLGSLVTVVSGENEKFRKEKYFVVSTAGGIRLEEENLMTISFASPLAKGLRKAKIDQDVIIKANGRENVYKILAIT